MVTVIPRTLTISDIGGRSALDPGQVGWYAGGSALVDGECAQCRFGCCARRYVIGVDQRTAIVVHGALGSA